MDYCEITDLAVDQCAHCKGVELVEKVDYKRVSVATRFVAQFESRGACGHPISVSDRVAYTVEDDLICEGCADR